MANWVSVEQALTDSGIFQDFENKIAALSEENIKELTGYLDALNYYKKYLDQTGKNFSTQTKITQRERKLAYTQQMLDQNNQDWTVMANLTGVYKTARGFKSMGTQVKNLKAQQQDLFDSTQGLEEFIKDGLIKLMNLEHEIMAALYKMNFFKQNIGDSSKGHNPIVDTYVIYFYGDKNDNGTQEIIRGQISSTDEAFMKHLVVNSVGDIELSKSIINDMMNRQHEIIANAKDPTNMDNTYQIYMDELIKEAGAFYNDIVKKVTDMLKESGQTHLGNDKDSELDAAATALSEREFVENIIEQHQENLRQFLYANEGYTGSSKNRINRGHLAEAFERLYQAHKDANPGEPNIDYATAVQESLGNDPWYMQGDVGTAQVKSFFDKSNRRVASLKSLQSLCEKLIMVLTSILSGNRENLTTIQDAAAVHYKIQAGQLAKANAKLENDCVRKTAEHMTQEVFKKS